MAMNLIIYAQNKQNQDEKITLCQANGFWGLWYRLCNCRHVDSDPYKRYLLREVWHEFLNYIEPNIELIKSASLLYGLEESGFNLSESQKQVIKEFQEWHGDTFEYTPVIGYNADAMSLIKWYEDKDEVWKFLYNNDYHVIISILG